MRKIFISLFFAVISISAFSQTKCFVNTDVLNVRSQPSLSGKKSGSLKFGDVVYVYETKGSGEYTKGNLDKWALISNGGPKKWVNCLYLTSFPTRIEYEYQKEIDEYNGMLAPWAQKIPQYIDIDDIIEENGVKYFSLSMYAFVSFNTKVLKGIKVKVDPVLKDFIPSDYASAIRTAEERTFSFDGKNYYTYDLNNNKYIISESLPENAFEYSPGKWKMGAPLNNFKVNEIKVQDNISLRKNHFCTNTRKLLKAEGYDYNPVQEGVILDYGIKIGMKKSDLIEVIGNPDEVIKSEDQRWVWESLEDFFDENPEWKVEGEEDILYIYEYDDPSYDESIYIKFKGDKISFLAYKFNK
ncbi:MAG: SH3 domain-containing protein [Treponema sp.]|nr:SH3 domain-containing protein [Treponema sp.]